METSEFIAIDDTGSAGVPAFASTWDGVVSGVGVSAGIGAGVGAGVVGATIIGNLGEAVAVRSLGVGSSVSEGACVGDDAGVGAGAGNGQVSYKTKGFQKQTFS